MQKILFVSSKRFSEINIKFINILFASLPISFLVGNGITNIIIFLIALVGFLTFSNRLFLEKNKAVFYLILFFFGSIFLSTLIDSWGENEKKHIFKSVTYFRYFFLFLVTSYLVKIEKFNFKYFLISTFLCTLILSLDIAFQFINGSDILGFKAYEKSKYHLAGFLQNEYIAGSYIQRFFVFGLILFPFFSKKLEKQRFTISLILTIIFFFGILYSGNRMPLIMFFISIFLIIIFIKNLRLPLIVGSFLCALIFYYSIKNNEDLKVYYESFYSNIDLIIDKGKEYAFKKYPELENEPKVKSLEDKNKFIHEFTNDEKLRQKYEMISFGSGHTVIYLTAIDLWTDSPMLGSGIKSFRTKCLGKLHLPNRICQSHPHNYYLELLNDTGLLGTLIFLFCLFFILKNKYRGFKKYKKIEKLLIICLFTVIFTELFPLRSTGSFFSTQSSAYIFLVLGILNGIKKIKI